MSVNTSDSLWTHTTTGGIPYKLVKQTGGIQEYQTSAQEEIIIQSNRLSAFQSECFPSPVIGFGGLYYPPRRRFPGQSHLHVTDLSWEALDDGLPVMPFRDGSAPTYYEHVRVRLQYAPVPFDDTEDPSDPLTFLQISANIAGTYIHGELRGAKDENGKDIPEPDTPRLVLETLVEWTLRWPMIPTEWFDDVLMPRMRAKAGFINDAASRIWKNAPAETILFTGFDFSTERNWSPDEGETRAPTNCTMKFIEKNFQHNGKQVTHNHIWLPPDKDGNARGWNKVQIEPGRFTYETADLDAIFTG